MKPRADAPFVAVVPAEGGASTAHTRPSIGGAAGADLGKLRRTEARCQTWRLLRHLWAFSSIARQRTCAHHHYGEGVEIRKRDDRAHFSGLISCGLVWTCPRCSQKIALERAADIAAAITTHYANGGRVTLVTPTIPHARSERLSDGWRLLDDAVKVMRDDLTVKRLRRALRLGTITRREVTDGGNGWHPHIHRLDFLRAGLTDQEQDDLENAERRAYTAAIAKAGRKLSPEHGITFRRLDLDAAHELIAGYVAKSVGLEMTDPGTKRARARGGRTPMQLLAAAADSGLERDWARWYEYEEAMKGRHSIRWSNGLRAALIPELGDELSDKQAAEAGDGLGRLLLLVPGEVWRRVIRSRPGPAILLQWAEVYDDDDEARDLINRRLAQHKLAAASPAAQPPPRPG